MKNSNLFVKNCLFLFALFLMSYDAKGQNLVPNGDFEQFISCPTSINQLTLAVSWINPATNSTPDYFHQCGSGGAGVPANFFGNQLPHSGAGYGGLIHYYNYTVGPNYREYAEVQLTSPLQPNQCYHFEMYVSPGDNVQWSTDDIAVYFSDTLINNLPYTTNLPFTPQLINTNGIISDTAHWTLVAGNYQATGGENYLLIGNYINDTTITLLANGFGSLNEAYYFIDDVALSPCTGIEQNSPNSEYLIYPNPASEKLTVSGKQFGEKAEIIITDILGKEVLKSEIKNPKSEINIKSFKDGIYFIEINGASLPDRQGNPNGYRDRKKFLKESLK
jgi:type IX secretion system substrate protein